MYIYFLLHLIQFLSSGLSFEKHDFKVRVFHLGLITWCTRLDGTLPHHSLHKIRGRFGSKRNLNNLCGKICHQEMKLRESTFKHVL